jgi:hypothetical protein
MFCRLAGVLSNLLWDTKFLNTRNKSSVSWIHEGRQCNHRYSNSSSHLLDKVLILAFHSNNSHPRVCSSMTVIPMLKQVCQIGASDCSPLVQLAFSMYLRLQQQTSVSLHIKMMQTYSDRQTLIWRLLKEAISIPCSMVRWVARYNSEALGLCRLQWMINCRQLVVACYLTSQWERCNLMLIPCKQMQGGERTS